MGRSKIVMFLGVGFLFVAIMAFGDVSGALAAETIEFKAGFFTSPDDPYGRLIHWYCTELEKRSKGAIKIKYFWSESLVSARDAADAMKSGLVDCTTLAPGYYPAKLPLYNIGWLPGILPLTGDSAEDWTKFFKIMNDWLETPALESEFARWNAVLITELYPAVYTIMGKFRIGNMADLKGRKIRAIGGAADVLSAAGAVPVFTTQPEMVDALQKGTIEAITHAWMNLHGFKVYEFSKYWTYGIRLAHMPSALAIRNNVYAKFPAEITKLIKEVRNDYQLWLADDWTKLKKTVMEDFRKAGIELIEFPSEDNQKLATLAEKQWGPYINKIEGQGSKGKEAFNSLQDIIKKYVPSHKPYYIR